MDFASVAERMAGLDRTTVTFNALRCLYATDRFSTCHACQGVCPVAAIIPAEQPGHPPALDAAACATCLACLPVCPTGAFTADDAVAPLLECAARVEASPLELVCQRHPAAEGGLSAEGAAIRVRGCLAGLGVGALVALVAMGAEAIALRADACDHCEWSALLPQTERQVAAAQQLLAPLGQAHKLTLLLEAPAAPAARPVLEADNPPLSRRDLFRLMARRGQVVLARAMNETGGATGPHPARERQRLLKALAALPAPEALPATPAGPGFALVQVSETCSACGACVRACPTGALEFERSEPPSYRLLFHAARCTGCEACQHVCAPAALTFDHQPSYAAVFGPAAPAVLSVGRLVRCTSCNTWMAAASGQKYCPTCTIRRAHPFGPRPMPGRAKVQP